jgi:hypothetical protein
MSELSSKGPSGKNQTDSIGLRNNQLDYASELRSSLASVLCTIFIVSCISGHFSATLAELLSAGPRFRASEGHRTTTLPSPPLLTLTAQSAESIRHFGQSSDLLHLSGIHWSALLRSSPSKLAVQGIAHGRTEENCDQLTNENNSKLAWMRRRDRQIRSDPSEADVCRSCDADSYGGDECERQKSSNEAHTLVSPIREGPKVV